MHMLMDAVAAMTRGDSGGMWAGWTETNGEGGETERWRNRKDGDEERGALRQEDERELGIQGYCIKMHSM